MNTNDVIFVPLSSEGFFYTTNAHRFPIETKTIFHNDVEFRGKIHSHQLDGLIFDQMVFCVICIAWLIALTRKVYKK